MIGRSDTEPIDDPAAVPAQAFVRKIRGERSRSRPVTWCILVIRRLIAFFNWHMFELNVHEILRINVNFEA